MPKKRAEPMPKYITSTIEQDAYYWCMQNNVKISPQGINGDPNHWKIAINVKGTWEVSPSKFGRDEIWQKFYEYCGYYYKKRS